MAGPDFKNGYKKGFEDGANSVEEGLPGWFGTFADMMTLLFAFFVLLAAISTMDPVKLQEMANSEGKSLGSKIKASGKAEEEGEFEPIKNLAEMKKEHGVCVGCKTCMKRLNKVFAYDGKCRSKICFFRR